MARWTRAGHPTHKRRTGLQAGQPPPQGRSQHRRVGRKRPRQRGGRGWRVQSEEAGEVPRDPGWAGGRDCARHGRATTREPKGRGPGMGGEARLWNDGETVAALEFSQLPPNRKGAGTWQPRGGGPGLRAEGRGGAAALSPPGRQSFRKRSEDPPGRASKGWGNPAKPAGATTGGTTLPEGEREERRPARDPFCQGQGRASEGSIPCG